MNLIERHVTSSTNEEIKTLIKEKELAEPTCLYTHHQFKGKGQKGNSWISEPYQNLTCSFFFNDLRIKVENQFYLSIYVSLAITNTLEKNGLKNVHVKWPNDILARNGKKLCGILIENTLSTALISQSVIGIGLNINQKKFDNLPNATSVALELGREINIRKVIENLIHEFENFSKDEILNVNLKNYYDKLYRYGKNTTFIDAQKNIFKGRIEGITDSGLLQVRNLNDQKLKSYNFKAIKFLDQS